MKTMDLRNGVTGEAAGECRGWTHGAGKLQTDGLLDGTDSSRRGGGAMRQALPPNLPREIVPAGMIRVPGAAFAVQPLSSP